jgi:hypothetical protein
MKTRFTPRPITRSRTTPERHRPPTGFEMTEALARYETKLRKGRRLDNGARWLNHMLHNEVRFRISWFWDGGIDFEILGDVSSKFNTRNVEVGMNWLVRDAARLTPKSAFAKSVERESPKLWSTTFEVLQRLYDSEINVSVTGIKPFFEVALGDAYNGVEWKDSQFLFHDAISSLAEAVLKNRPTSEFAQDVLRTWPLRNDEELVNG